MLNIILLLVAGSLISYLAKYNLEPVNVVVGTFSIENIPLFYVIVASIIVGLILSYLIQMLRNITTYLEIRSKTKEIKVGKEEILDLTKTVHQLELENEKLKHSEPEIGDPKGL